MKTRIATYLCVAALFCSGVFGADGAYSFPEIGKSYIITFARAEAKPTHQTKIKVLHVSDNGWILAEAYSGYVQLGTNKESILVNWLSQGKKWFNLVALESAKETEEKN